MNFIACDGEWSAGASGELLCTGQLVSIADDEMQGLIGSALTWDDVSELQGEAMILFATVFGFLVLKKVLKSR
ncbi:hypothetical protein CDR19_18500 [Ectopseudomonas toyotomiensis]|jgi:hypothetical protein|uniref:Uncharacterized protein n=1 Tax=Ectopseudomonas toyotomiensis TaxID=554344 RepID=A0A1I5SLD6_9GAMM|nr:hypothetical protein [Pseudomonas toyotomiensis]PIA69474.1 hypothetical protein CDR19_18500 [Pseudomonas toyotomiensis]SFP71522.1 hypothetical protein SAMN05216177_104311 [Pseudomonas toyotomiensis]